MLLVKVGFVAYNKDTYSPEIRRKSYLKHKEKYKKAMREYSLKRKFSLSVEDYNSMLKEQDGVCAICKSTCTRSLAVDHCHTTGKIRGLLCNNCNRGIGHLKDSILLLESSIRYLKERG